ncbi:MAG: metal-dependent transcriptional regulator [Ferruginibacter sp.]
MLSYTEENYLKALLHLTYDKKGKKEAGTNELALFLAVKPATVNDMLRKLKEKKLIDNEKYGKSALTREGRKKAIEIIRKHRLWETFLFRKLGFSWDEVHEVAEQLEHIQSSKLIDRLDKFLEYPSFDPHGDVIPNAKGEMKTISRKTLLEEETGHQCTIIAVKDNSTGFLQYADQLGVAINSKIKILARQDYDDLLLIEVDGKTSSVSPKFAGNIVIVCEQCSK